MDITNFNKYDLGFLPTPVNHLKNFSKILGGPEILIKRDDLTGLAFGGNKTRKLEFIIADALKHGADTLVTGGARQSNHCRQTAAAAAKASLECHLALAGDKPKFYNSNLLLNHLFDAKIHWCGENRKGEDIPRIIAELKQNNKAPYLIPYGGSNEYGTLSFVAAIKELKEQMGKEINNIKAIIFASSSGGTQAGFILGRHICGLEFEIIGINIDKEGEELPLDDKILQLLIKAGQKLNLNNINFSKEDICINNDYLGKGYGIISDSEKAAISMLAKSEGILLDPVYTARAMAALIDLVKKNSFSAKDKILFWHTGGTPVLFDSNLYYPE
ncbi:MAG: D-cysteine desulfhydrase family protein [Rickettsiaceae bacterium]|nr:D-cysteine desulfhydrase family protein [Rickettsiaceae bacterium]